jgi:hypothetical protein
MLFQVFAFLFSVDHSQALLDIFPGFSNQRVPAHGYETKQQQDDWNCHPTGQDAGFCRSRLQTLGKRLIIPKTSDCPQENSLRLTDGWLGDEAVNTSIHAFTAQTGAVFVHVDHVAIHNRDQVHTT